MLQQNQFRALAKICRDIANEVSDESGFVPIRNLLDRFRAQLVIRPLLVEGMIASVGDGHSSGWTLFVDSETYSVAHDDVDKESSIKPLPTRFRNTVAHELAHSLAFRPSEFGLQLKSHRLADQDEFVKSVERDTERLSPLMLVSERSIARLITEVPKVNIDAITKMRESNGVSRQVLVQRLASLRSEDPGCLLASPRFENIAIGVAEWNAHGSAMFRSWPLFLNFRNGIVPSFLISIGRQDRTPASAVLTAPTFLMNGGFEASYRCNVDAGTDRSPKSGTMEIRISTEVVPRDTGAEFLFMVHG